MGTNHLAQALAHEAWWRGYDVIFINTHRLLQHLYGGWADGGFERRLQAYLPPDLLVRDDLGLKPLRPPGLEDLYDLINERCDRASIMLTSNRAPSRWPNLFSDPLLASAGLDRPADNAHRLVIAGATLRARRQELPLQEERTEVERTT